ncbi:hypothetical protein LOTGIDRAFT_153421 [Lottia gigantea]|uniref:Uncharacterized protein n=1 Tax=Lottia gigantea TaxID=225164 RepID=V4AAY3_LOTGI|nr:hypothetical protein LOTGIDRAFT_153421 [Lottia gigantea]ESO93942.1 hypothetical protein LOTGIDRAFT_153421 [Lottia gigantea]
MADDDGVKLGVKIERKTGKDMMSRSPRSSPRVKFYMSDGGLNEDNYRDILMYEKENNPNSMGNRMIFEDEYRFIKDSEDFYVSTDLGELENRRKEARDDDLHILEDGDSKSKRSTLRHRLSNIPHYLNKPILEYLGMIFSALYGMIMVLLGLVINISRTYTLDSSYNSHLVFSLYLFITGKAFLVLAMLCLLRTTPLRTRIRYFLSKEIVFSEANSKGLDEAKDNPLDFKSTAGSFYLRLTAMGFGIGSMIMTGLKLGEFLEKVNELQTVVIIEGVSSSLHIIFTFIQLYFIFRYSKACFKHNKIVVRFGLSHLAATNICVWLAETVTSTLELSEVNITTLATNSSGIPRLKTNLGDIIESINSYLYPCIIQYSFVCSGILCMMWKNIDGYKTNECHQDYKKSTAKQQQDCSGASRGLFFGVLILVVTVIISIVFVVLLKGDFISQSTAFRTQYISEIIVSIILSVAAILAFWNWKTLHFEAKKRIELEEILLLISLLGVYSFYLFSIVAAHQVKTESSGIVVGASSILMLEITLQFVLTLCGMRMCSKSNDHRRVKPGREILTFLLVSNVALFGIDVAVVQNEETNPIQIKFYGNLAWYLIVHISWPFVLSFRVLIVICISNIWKTNLMKKMSVSSEINISSSEC